MISYSYFSLVLQKLQDATVILVSLVVHAWLQMEVISVYAPLGSLVQIVKEVSVVIGSVIDINKTLIAYLAG